MKTIGILQPGYFPWLGFFEQMSRSDVFVFLDDVQYSKNDWRNRNRIKTKDGIQWLTVPVSFSFGQKINEVRVDSSSSWAKKHIQALRTWYNKSVFYKQYREDIEQLLSKPWRYLVDLDIDLIRFLMKQMGLQTATILSSELALQQADKQLRIVEICELLGGECFYEGESGRKYIDTTVFGSHNIIVEFQRYEHPYYNQLWLREQGFISHLSAIDLLLNHGPDSLAILTGRKRLQALEKLTVRRANDV